MGVFALLVVTLVACIPFPVLASKGFEFHIEQDKLSGAPATKRRKAIEAKDAIYVSDGHFYNVGPDLARHTGDDERVRFLGINLSPPLTFPRTDEEADRLISRIAKLGFNIVRLHGLDAGTVNQSETLVDVSGRGSYPAMNRDNIAALDRLFRACESYGIYVDLVLKVAYTFRGGKDCYTDADGVEKHCVASAATATTDYPEPVDMPDGSRPLDLFDRVMIELQKRYFSSLLSRYADRPVLALVELNNENSLIESYSNGKLFPPLYAQQLDRMWNQWLARKYESTDALRAAWRPARVSGAGHDIIVNGDFSSVVGGVPKGWRMINRGGKAGRARLRVERRGGLEIYVEKPPRPYWSVYLYQEGIELREGAGYCISLRARSDRNKMMEVALQGQIDSPRFQFLPKRLRFRLGKQMRSQEFCFVSPRSESGARLVIMPEAGSTHAGRTWIKGIALREVDVPGLPKGSFLADRDPARRGNVPRPSRRHDHMGLVGLVALNDYIEFLDDTEKAYYQEMIQYLKTVVSVDKPMTGTQANYGGLVAQKTANDLMDYLDVHYYWDHPHNTGRAENMWWMKNKPMEQEPRNSIVRRIVEAHVENMPLTIGEFSSNMLNDYAVGGLLLAAAYGAYQDIDGLFLFNYYRVGGDERDSLDPDQVVHWYNILGHAGAEAMMPLVRNIFLRGDVSSAREVIKLPIDETITRKQVLRGADVRNIAVALEDDAYFSDVRGKRFDITMALLRGIRIRHYDGNAGRARLPSFPDTASPIKVSDTGQLKWKPKAGGEEGAWFIVDSERTKAVSGDLGRVFRLSDANVQGYGHNYGLVALTALDDRPISVSRHILVTVIGRGRNRNLKAIARGSGYTLCTSSRRGICGKPFWHPDAGPFVMSRVPVRVTLKSDAVSVKVWALNERGRPYKRVPVERVAEGYAFGVGEGQRDAPWFEVFLD